MSSLRKTPRRNSLTEKPARKEKSEHASLGGSSKIKSNTTSGSSRGGKSTAAVETSKGKSAAGASSSRSKSTVGAGSSRPKSTPAGGSSRSKSTAGSGLGKSIDHSSLQESMETPIRKKKSEVRVVRMMDGTDFEVDKGAGAGEAKNELSDSFTTPRNDPAPASRSTGLIRTRRRSTHRASRVSQKVQPDRADGPSSAGGALGSLRSRASRLASRGFKETDAVDASVQAQERVFGGADGATSADPKRTESAPLRPISGVLSGKLKGLGSSNRGVGDSDAKKDRFSSAGNGAAAAAARRSAPRSRGISLDSMDDNADKEYSKRASRRSSARRSRKTTGGLCSCMSGGGDTDGF